MCLRHVPLTGWTSPDELKHLQLDARDAVTLSKMRATYMIQLLVDMCANSASSDTWLQLFSSLKDKTIQRDLVTLDSCCINGLQEFCSVWTEAT